MLKAKMSSTESGFLQVGMPVKIKFDAYPFQDYGIIEGRVTWISPDSKITETPQGSIQTFELDIALDQSYIQARNKRISLSPGQTATAEVIVRQRRIIDFILDPFKKLQKGGLEL
jgi:HlyD family secretion protein